jgi:hypothetical protein
VIDQRAQGGDKAMNIVRNKTVNVGVLCTLFTGLVVTVLLGTGAAQISQSSPAAPVPAKHLTHKQAAHLIITASTPADHRELAQYFRQEAQKKRDKEQYYMETTVIYGVHPPRVDMYRNMSTQDYYNHLAVEAHNLALADDQLAAYHDKLAGGLPRQK